jgi:hypothetical protein
LLVAAICRCRNGLFLGASVLAVLETSDPLTLEAIACREILTLTQPICILNYLYCFKLPKNSQLHTQRKQRKLLLVLCEIGMRRLMYQETKFIHERRSSNTYVHNLARSMLF